MTIKRLVTGGNIKKDGPTFPVELHLKAVGALTLHTGVRDRRMKHTGAERPVREAAGSPAFSMEFTTNV